MAQSFTSKDRVRLNTLCLRMIFFNTRFHYLKTVTLIIKRFSECVKTFLQVKAKPIMMPLILNVSGSSALKSDIFVYDNTTLALKHFRKPFVVANYMLCMCLVSRVNSCVAHPPAHQGALRESRWWLSLYMGVTGDQVKGNWDHRGPTVFQPLLSVCSEMFSVIS